ncbi:MAG TPA: prepilin-type N-terminal cleavage/methylation domain-containing protein [Candidatus Paceibacterota bacterium]|nr:prepilin-type N-terminal cleavage/methylation domain-containing protein [Candidatus Paceibacterota bacterium]
MFTIRRGGHRGGHKLGGHKTTKGFTLIELLVVIAIIGILSSVVLASLNSARQKGRDAKRISDVKQIQLALELYYDANGKYPATISTSTLVTPGYIAALPQDPVGNTAYAYVPYALTSSAAVCSGYHLGASLEGNSNSVLQSDADANGFPSGYGQCTGGAASDFNGVDTASCTTGDAGASCYDVKS